MKVYGCGIQARLSPLAGTDFLPACPRIRGREPMAQFQLQFAWIYLIFIRFRTLLHAQRFSGRTLAANLAAIAHNFQRARRAGPADQRPQFTILIHTARCTPTKGSHAKE
jgi:hypothetical protein